MKVDQSLRFTGAYFQANPVKTCSCGNVKETGKYCDYCGLTLLKMDSKEIRGLHDVALAGNCNIIQGCENIHVDGHDNYVEACSDFSVSGRRNLTINCD